MNRLILLLTMVSVSMMMSAQENSQWRGENRDGIYNETGLLTQWPEGGPELLWHNDELGEGYSSAAIANDKIYITGMIDSTGYLFVFDLKGNMLSKKDYGLEWNENYNGSRSAVNVNDGRLYIFTGRGVLLCYDEKTLDLIWSKNFMKDFDGSQLKFGITESHLIVGDILYATPGGENNNMVALNKRTGDVLWSSKGTGKPSTYCSPQYVDNQEMPMIVNAIDSSLVAINARTGELLWEIDQKNPYGMSPNTPIYMDKKIFSTTGGGIGSMLLQITDGGKKIEKLWSNEMDNKMGGAVKVGNYIYGSGEKNRYWYCIDWNTGETVYKDNKIGVGNVIACNGMLYCYSDRGEMALVKPGADKFDIMGKFNITMGTNQHWAHPVIYKGVLYVRHGSTLMAYKI
jgi:hypothetical protein